LLRFIFSFVEENGEPKLGFGLLFRRHVLRFLAGSGYAGGSGFHCASIFVIGTELRAYASVFEIVLRNTLGGLVVVWFGAARKTAVLVSGWGESVMKWR